MYVNFCDFGLSSNAEKVWNVLKVNNKNDRTTSLVSFWCLYY